MLYTLWILRIFSWGIKEWNNIMGDNIVILRISLHVCSWIWYNMYGRGLGHLFPVTLFSTAIACVGGRTVTVVGMWWMPTPQAGWSTGRVRRPVLYTLIAMTRSLGFVHCRGIFMCCFLKVVFCCGRFSFKSSLDVTSSGNYLSKGQCWRVFSGDDRA